MNYFALAGGIIAGLIALRAVLRIITVSTGRKKYIDPQAGFAVNACVAAVFGALTAWLFSMAAA